MKKLNLVCLLIAVAALSAAAQNGSVEAFDKYAEAARKAWNVPGMSVVVVQDGKVVLAKGYGVKELGKNDPVDSETLFGAMSTTKAMVAVAMGILVDEGKVKWDDKVTKHLPDFKVADPYVTKEITVRDLFTHNAGMGNADFLWTVGDLPGTEIVSRMQYAKPVYSMRGGFIYQNIMYEVAGQVIAKASGMSWERFMNERVFGPLGMNNTFPTLASSRKYSNQSVAHYEVKGELKPIPETAGVDAVAPAGAVWSTANDIAKWVNFNLGFNPNGKEILKPATLAEIQKPQVVIPSNFYPTFPLLKTHWTTYGFGWFQHDYRGEMVHMHTGSLAGRTAIVGMMRDKKLGVYIFGNVDHAEVRHALIYKVFDLFGFNDNSRDWSTEMKAMYDAADAESRKRVAAQLAGRKPNTTPSLPLAAYAGVYSDPLYGSHEIKLVDGKLRFILAKDRTADLAHWQDDSFRGPWNESWRGETTVTFRVNAAKTEVEGISAGGGVLLKRQAKPGQ